MSRGRSQSHTNFISMNQILFSQKHFKDFEKSPFAIQNLPSTPRGRRLPHSIQTLCREDTPCMSISPGLSHHCQVSMALRNCCVSPSNTSLAPLLMLCLVRMSTEQIRWYHPQFADKHTKAQTKKLLKI